MMLRVCRASPSGETFSTIGAHVYLDYQVIQIADSRVNLDHIRTEVSYNTSIH